MDLIVLLKELSSTGISDFVIVGVALLVVRYWFSEMRRAISQEIDDKVGAAKSDLEGAIKENRDAILSNRLYTERSNKEIMLHLIDVRERLANIEGRLGAPTPRMSEVALPLEARELEPVTPN